MKADTSSTITAALAALSLLAPQTARAARCGTFDGELRYDAGEPLRGVFVADVDGDGDNDLLATPGLNVMLNEGDQTFGAPISYGSDSRIAIADLDDDGDLDVASTGGLLKFNHGDGTFNRGYGIQGGSTVAAGDVDDDGDVDLVFAGSDKVRIHLNDGRGFFAPKPIDFPTGDTPSDIACTDLDGDGDLDVATTNEQGNDVSVLLNTGDLTFAPHVRYGIGEGPFSLAADDLDGDGDMDLVAGNEDGDDLSVLLNNGDGTFADEARYPAGDAPRHIALGDIDADGDVDVVASHWRSNDLRAWLNDGAGAFASPRRYPAENPQGIDLADLDGDGAPDLAVGLFDAEAVAVRWNLCDACPADIDGNADVGFGDLVALLAAWGPCDESCPEDLDGDDSVGFADLLELLTSWGACPGACCLFDGTCRTTDAEACLERGGVYQGDGASCATSCATADECADAILIGEETRPYSTRDATSSEPFALPAECNEGRGTQIREDGWFLYEATCDGDVTVSACESSYDARLAVYDAADCPGTFIACNDDACGEAGTRPALSFTAVAGERYLIRIGAYTSTLRGTGALVIECEGG